MDKIERIAENIKEIERLLNEIKNALEFLKNKDQNKTNSAEKDESVPSDEYLMSEYEKLYNEFITKKSGHMIHEFVKGKSKTYLKYFCRVNKLPIDTTRASKDKIAEEVVSWMMQRAAITKKIT